MDGQKPQLQLRPLLEGRVQLVHLSDGHLVPADALPDPGRRHVHDPGHLLR